MQLMIAGLVFVVIATFLAGFQKRVEPAKVDLQGRLKNVIQYEEFADIRQAELSTSLSERLISPMLGALSGLATRLLPTEILQSLEKKVQQSGRTGGFSARDYLGMKVIFAIGLPITFYIVSGGVLETRVMMLMGVSALIGWKFPDVRLDSQVRSRINDIEKNFPDVLDLLTVSVEAGLGFDGAMAKVVEKSEGPVAEEFRRVLHEVKMGKTRRDALRDFADRSGVDDVRSFTSAIIQSDQLGLNIGKTLKNQSEQMRRKRRQRVEEKAMKVPVKMLIPMVTFIFPTIFVVLLGPALIQIMESMVM
ncbi:MAG: type II secretion system F family protein [Bacillota bacterium]|nr:type II secretion system F family protein [Bacillota bacterium]MDW7683950.1 type II secretion system F family protein [Bacillota bacterium]